MSRQYSRRNQRATEPVPRDFWQFFRGPQLWASPQLWTSFLAWRKQRSCHDYALFAEDCAVKRESARKALEAWQNPFANATKGKPYAITFPLPFQAIRYGLCGLDKAGLQCEANHREQTLAIRGTPPEAGEFEISFVCIWPGWQRGMPLLKRSFSLLVNPDPAELWKDIPSDQSGEYARPDLQAQELVCDNMLLLGASRRGRSHAHVGAPRDDAFALGCQAGWQILAVADGAGSAPFSRAGADIACATALHSCQTSLAGNADLERVFLEVDWGNQEWLAKAKKAAYEVLARAAFDAHKAVRREAEKKELKQSLFASTLLLTIARKFTHGWAVISFQIGDGAMAVITAAGAELLAEPDEGEFAGQTRFITMNEIFQAQELMQRLRILFLTDLQGIVLMSDGVSDARFASMDNLRNQENWRALWAELLPLARGDDPKGALLEWLNFWSRGNHDDRTLAMMLPVD